MSENLAAVRRTPLDVIFGLVVTFAGLLLLFNVVFATAFSVLFIGWTALVAGVIQLGGALLRIRSGGFFATALGGAILTALGLFIVRNALIGAVALTLLAGAMFLANGLARLVAAAQASEARWLLVASGVASVLLGLWVFFNISAATVSLLGTLLGIQTVIEGLMLLAVGRVHRSPERAAKPVAGAATRP